MDFAVLFKKARLLNKVNKPRAALNLLKHLYKQDASNLDIILEVVTAFEKLGDRVKARSMLVKGIMLYPKNDKLWIRLSRIYQAEGNRQSAFKAINKALFYNPENLPLLIQKSRLLAAAGQVNKMRSLLDATIIKHPAHKKHLLIERATLYQLLSRHPAQNEAELVKDRSGKVYAVRWIKKAINDLNDAMDCDEEDPQIPIKLARLYSQLNNFELALITYDDVLSMLDSEAHTLKLRIQQERDDCLNNSTGNTEPIVKSQDEGLLNSEAEAGSGRDYAVVTKLCETTVNRSATAKPDPSHQKTHQGNQYQQKAISIAEDILKIAREPNAGYTAVKLDSSTKKFCDQVEQEIKKIDFLTLGDFEAKGLNQYLGKRVVMRLFVSRSLQICAAACEIRPLKPSLLAWLLLVLLGKWKTVRYLELQSETVEGVFKITNNNSEVSPFDTGNQIKIKNLAVISSVYDIVLAHKIRLQKHSQRNYKLIPDLKAFFSFQERIRHAKNAYRESVGFVTDEELKHLLGSKFDRFSSDIKSYLEKINEQSCDVNYGSLQPDPVTEQTG